MLILKTVEVILIYLLLIMFRSCLSQSQRWLASWKVFVQKWFFSLHAPHAREQCIFLAQNSLKWVHAHLWIGLVCSWSIIKMLCNFLPKTSWVSTCLCKWNSCQVMVCLESTCYKDQNAKRTTHFGALVKKLCPFELWNTLCHD